MFENEYLNFDNLFNDDIDNSDFDDIEEANEGVYKKPSKLTAITPENTEPWLSSEKTVQNFSKSYLYDLCRRQKKLQKMLTKVDKKSQDYKDIMTEMNANKKIAKKILDARKKFGLPDIRNDSSFASIAGYGLLGNELINRYISKNQSSLEACDEYDDFDDAEEASANYNLKKAMQYNKKSAKNNYIASQKYKEISENPNVDEDDRRSSARKAKYHMDMAKHHAGKAKDNDFNIKNNKFVSNPYYSNKLKEIYDEDAANKHRKSREESARDGKKRREAYIQANDSRNCKAKEDAFGLFEDDFEFEQDVLALEDAISMLVDEDEREDEFDRAVDEIEEINHPVDEILDEATESTGLFDTSTPAISNSLFEDLFKPATEAVEDDDEDGDLLEEDDGDDDFSDDELDGYVEPKQDYSDKEYDRDEALEEDF